MISEGSCDTEEWNKLLLEYIKIETGYFKS